MRFNRALREDSYPPSGDIWITIENPWGFNRALREDSYPRRWRTVAAITSSGFNRALREDSYPPARARRGASSGSRFQSRAARRLLSAF